MQPNEVKEHVQKLIKEPGSPWKSEAALWDWVRQSMRSALWFQLPTKVEYKKSLRAKKPIGRPMKSGANQEVFALECNLCNEWVKFADAQVDHIVDAGAIDEEHLVEFLVKGMLALTDNQQIVCKCCHKAKTYAAKQSIPYEDAKKIMVVMPIARTNSDSAEQLDWILENIPNGNLLDTSNASKRRSIIKEHALTYNNYKDIPTPHGY